MNAQEILSAKCTNLDGATAAIQALALEETKRFILNYCHIYTIPPEACFIWANMALDLINGSYLPDRTVATDAIKANEIGSVTAGDMSVSRDASLISHKIDLDSLLFNYREQLNRFRRIDWGMNRCSGWGF